MLCRIMAVLLEEPKQFSRYMHDYMFIILFKGLLVQVNSSIISSIYTEYLPLLAEKLPHCIKG